MAVILPKEKSPKTLTAESAKVLLYGPPKIGKSTLAAALDPDHTLFLACEPGLGGLEVFTLPVRSWEDFKEAYTALHKAEHSFGIVVVDTVDELFRYCTEATMKELGISHPSDLGYGKGWNAVGDKFRLAVGALANLGLGVWFISHSKDEEIKGRVGTITKSVPTVGGQARAFLLGFCDHIFYATSEQTKDGEHRVLRTSATENYEAGSRIKGLQDPIALDAKALSKAITEGLA